MDINNFPELETTVWTSCEGTLQAEGSSYIARDKIGAIPNLFVCMNANRSFIDGKSTGIKTNKGCFALALAVLIFGLALTFVTNMSAISLFVDVVAVGSLSVLIAIFRHNSRLVQNLCFFRGEILGSAGEFDNKGNFVIKLRYRFKDANGFSIQASAEMQRNDLTLSQLPYEGDSVVVALSNTGDFYPL